jgi:hypothetical protein
VSICLPVYNGANYLEVAIESALAQTYNDFELLIADDCSTDETPKIIRKYAKQDERIKAWTNAQNLKLFGNYNACIEKASGKFVKLFAHDDLFEPNLLERMLAVFEKHPKVSLVTSARCWIDGQGKRIDADSAISAKTMRPFDQDTYLSAKDAITGTLKDVINWLGEPSSQMFKREFADGGYDVTFKQIGDLEYSYRLLKHGDYYFIADELCYFRSHEQSWSTARGLDLTAYLDWFVLGAKYSEYLSQADMSPEQYCLNVIRATTAALEDRLSDSAGELLEPEQLGAIKALFGTTDLLSFFKYGRGESRNLAREEQALGIIAFVQCAVLENELRLVHQELARAYSIEIRGEALAASRGDIANGIEGLKQALRRKNRHIDALKRAVRKSNLLIEDYRAKYCALQHRVNEQEKEIKSLRALLNAMGSSLSWKVTEPLRMLKGQRP